MARYFRLPFADAGDKTTIPDATQPNGVVSYNQGYGPTYSLNPVTDPGARRTERNMFNQLMFDVTSTLQLYYQTGVPPFITAAQNGGTAYPYGFRARVLYDPGDGIKLYESLRTNNTNLPSVTAAWARIDINGLDDRYLNTSDAGTAATLNAGQNSGEVARIGNPATTGNTAVVVRSGSNENGFFRVWSDDYKEQFGISTATGGGSAGTIVTYPVPYTNLASVNTWPGTRDNTGGNAEIVIVHTGTGFTFTTTQFELFSYSGTVTNCRWFSIGY